MYLKYFWKDYFSANETKDYAKFHFKYKLDIHRNLAWYIASLMFMPQPNVITVDQNSYHRMRVKFINQLAELITVRSYDVEVIEAMIHGYNQSLNKPEE